MRKESLQKFIGNDYKKCVYLFVEIGLILFFAGILFMLVYVNPFTIWADEIVSLQFFQGSFEDIIKNYANDSYPPMEGLLRKIFVYLFTDSPFSNKVFSIVPTILMMFYMLFFLRKEFSDRIASIFLLSICASFPIVHYSIEIRMYTWALFFVSMLIPAAWYIIKTGKIKWWLLFTASAICAAYTHYYAMLNALISYCFLLVYVVLKDKKQIKKALFAGLLGVILYSPWISILLMRFKASSNNFWIGPITKDTVLWFLKFPFHPFWGVYNGLCDKIVANIYSYLFVVFLGTFFWQSLRKGWPKDKSFGISFSFVSFITTLSLLLVGLIISLCTRPLILDRYLFCSLGLLFFFFAVIVGSVRNTKICTAVAILLFLIASCGILTKYSQECQSNKNTTKFVNFLKNVNKEDIILFLNEPREGHIIAIFKYFLRNKGQIYFKEDFLSIKEKPKTFWIISPVNINVKEGTKLYGTFQEDFYWFNIYFSEKFMDIVNIIKEKEV